MNIVWKKREAPPPSIKRMAAGIEPVCGMFFCMFLFVLLIVQMEVFRYHTSALYLEDALAASNLAAAVIDLEEYGISDTIRITDLEGSYERFIRALGTNLGLNEQGESGNPALITGKVTVERFIVYNLTGSGEYSTERNTQGKWEYCQAPVGGMYAPNGQLVEHTGIYSEVSYEVQGFFGVTIQARDGVLVDVVSGEKKGEME